jgi:hypothetical protein
MTRPNAIFSEAELQFVKVRAGTMKNVDLHAAFVMQFNRLDITATQIKNCCRCRGWPRGLRRSGKARWRRAARSRSYLHDGCLEVDDGSGRYRQMQRIMWEEIVGPIPEGSYLMPLNGDKFDFDPFNWIMLSSSMMNRLRQSPFFTAPPELRSTVFAAAKLKQALRDRTGRTLQIRLDRVGKKHS